MALRKLPVDDSVPLDIQVDEFVKRFRQDRLAVSAAGFHLSLADQGLRPDEGHTGLARVSDTSGILNQVRRQMRADAYFAGKQ